MNKHYKKMWLTQGKNPASGKEDGNPAFDYKLKACFQKE